MRRRCCLSLPGRTAVARRGASCGDQSGLRLYSTAQYHGRRLAGQAPQSAGRVASSSGSTVLHTPARWWRTAGSRGRFKGHSYPEMDLPVSAPARILVVEDEGIVGLDIQSKLEAMGYDVPTVVSTGAEAISSAERSA